MAAPFFDQHNSLVSDAVHETVNIPGTAGGERCALGCSNG